MDVCPLSNQPCPHRRTTHVTEINDGKITELHLCENCASKYPEKPVVKNEPPKPIDPVWAAGQNQPNTLLSLLQLLAGGLGSNQIQLKVPIHPPCPKCGITTEEIRKTGRLGCPHCYDYFGKAIMQVISHCQQGIQHVGKKPKGWDDKQAKLRNSQEEAADIEDRINSLKLKMAKAIEVENYEVAGVLKKKIEELRGGTLPTPPSSEDQ